MDFPFQTPLLRNLDKANVPLLPWDILSPTKQNRLLLPPAIPFANFKPNIIRPYQLSDPKKKKCNSLKKPRNFKSNPNFILNTFFP